MAQVPNVDVDFDGDGATAIFDFDFPYQKQSEIFVTVDGVNTAYTWLAGNTHSVQVLPAPALGTKVRIYRSTLAFAPLHVFAAGVPFLPRYVDENNRQMLYVVQEGIDTSNNAETIARGIADVAEAAFTAAADAQAVAGNALGVAQGIAGTANAALVASGQAVTTANNALSVANGIDAKATAALNASAAATTSANNAVVTANAVDAKAQSALDAAATATSTANTANATANVAKTTADTALAAVSGAGQPVGSLVIWDISEGTLPSGYIPRNGQLVSRAMWPELWALVSAVAITDASWVATPLSRGKFSSGDGSTTFRMPDLNGKYPDGLTPAAFLRGYGLNSAGTPGLMQLDQMQGVRYRISQAYFNNAVGNVDGPSNSAATPAHLAAAETTSVRARTGPAETDGTNGTPRIGAETRPFSSTVIWCCIGGTLAVNLGTVDITATAAQVTAQGSSIAGHAVRISALESIGKPFTKEFVSAQLAYTLGGGATQPHGLGAKPKLAMASLICITAEQGFVAGDEIKVADFFVSGTNLGVELSYDVTSIVARMATVATFNRVSGAAFNPVPANWRLILRAWA